MPTTTKDALTALADADNRLSEALEILDGVTRDCPTDLEVGAAALQIVTVAAASVNAINSTIQTLLTPHHDDFVREGQTKVLIVDGLPRLELSGGSTNTEWDSPLLYDHIKGDLLTELTEAYGPRNAGLCEGVLNVLGDRLAAVNGIAENKSSPWRSRALRDQGYDPDKYSQKHKRPKKVRIPQ